LSSGRLPRDRRSLEAWRLPSGERLLEAMRSMTAVIGLHGEVSVNWQLMSVNKKPNNTGTTAPTSNDKRAAYWRPTVG
jgi:hypothetical protein